MLNKTLIIRRSPLCSRVVVSLSLSACLLSVAFSDTTQNVRDQIPFLPLRFTSVNASAFDWQQGSVFGLGPGVFVSEDLWAEYAKAENLFFRGSTTARMLGSKDSRGKVIPPLALTTSEDLSSFPFFSINTTQIGALPDGKERVMRDFNFVDLISCVPDEKLHRFLSILESRGTLVLPYSGVDFANIDSLPRDVEKLVIYNTQIGKDFARLIGKCEHLSDLTLINCYDSHDVRFPSAGHGLTVSNTLTVTRDRLKKLTILNGTPQLVGWFGGWDMPQLEELSLIYPASFGPARPKKKGPTPSLPEYPQLRKVSVFYNRSLFSTAERLELAIDLSAHTFDRIMKQHDAVITHFVIDPDSAP